MTNRPSLTRWVFLLQNGSTMTDSDRSPNWRVWRSRKGCELWQAVFLSMNIEPECMEAAFDQWMHTDRKSPSGSIGAEFCDRMMVARTNVSESGPIYPMARRLGPYQHPRVEVVLREVAAFFNGLAADFPTPREFKEFAGDLVPGGLKREALTRKYTPTWPSIERDLRDGHKNGLSQQAKTAVRGYWFELEAVRWAMARGKLTLKNELDVVFRRPWQNSIRHTIDG
jgi:hypothetical protein